MQLSNDPSPGYNIEQMAKRYVSHLSYSLLSAMLDGPTVCMLGFGSVNYHFCFTCTCHTRVHHKTILQVCNSCLWSHILLLYAEICMHCWNISRSHRGLLFHVHLVVTVTVNRNVLFLLIIVFIVISLNDRSQKTFFRKCTFTLEAYLLTVCCQRPSGRNICYINSLKHDYWR